MKQVIRTIIAYYNGHEFIKEQVDSILNQEGIENFDNQVYIYDDGSKKESLDKLIEIYKDEPRVKVFSDGINKGLYFRFLVPFAECFRGGVDFIFWADQDDKFVPNKYITHINKHNEIGESVIISSDYQWFFTENRVVEKYKNGRGHNFSFCVKKFSEKFKFDVDKFIEVIDRTKSDFPSYLHHDAFILFVAITKDDIYGMWGVPTAYHRVHTKSITNSGSMDGRPWRIWTDQYNIYFLGAKPVIKEIFNIDLTINQFNKKIFFHDPNATSKQSIAGWIKWKLDNFAMRIRCKWMRNLIPYMSRRSHTTKQGRKDSMIEYKKFIKEQESKLE